MGCHIDWNRVANRRETETALYQAKDLAFVVDFGIVKHELDKFNCFPERAHRTLFW
jgi:hypothetical protein